MTHGAVILAFNNKDIDYTKLACFSAERVKKFLNIPVTLITDSKKYLESSFPNHNFDKVIEIPGESYSTRILHDGAMAAKDLEWKNANRHKVFDLSPYDKTLVIDSDYIINSSNLLNSFENDHNFQIYKNSFDIATWRNLQEFERINPYSIPFHWATVFVFVKNDFTETFFNLVEYIKDNWNYYKVLYSIEPSYPLFRNDFAFSIAINILNGKTKGEFAIDLPGKMAYTLDKDILINLRNDEMFFLLEKQHFFGEYFLAKTTGLDVHVMNKLSLLRHIDGEQVV